MHTSGLFAISVPQLWFDRELGTSGEIAAEIDTGISVVFAGALGEWRRRLTCAGCGEEVKPAN